MRPSLLLSCGLFAAAAGACGDGRATADAAASGAIAEVAYRLPGFDETLLVADDDGEMAVVHLGEPTRVTRVPAPLGTGVVSGRPFAGKLWVLASNGELTAVDPSVATHSDVRHVDIGAPGDLEMESADVAWIADSANGRVVRVSTETGSVLDVVDLGALALNNHVVKPTHMARVGERLFVAVSRGESRGAPRGAVAVIDIARRAIDKVLELEAPLSAGGAPVPGINPGAPLALDEAHGKLFVPTLGYRPSDTGLLLRIDLERIEVDPWSLRQGAGFQGGMTIGKSSNAFVAYHTSTPVASTHVFRYRLTDDGGLTPAGAGTLIEAFEVFESYPANAAHTLFAFTVGCPMGFCNGGVGVSFVDATTAEVYPRLGLGELGIKPMFAMFL